MMLMWMLRVKIIRTALYCVVYKCEQFLMQVATVVIN